MKHIYCHLPSVTRIILTLLGTLMLLGGTRSVAAASCASVLPAAPPSLITRAQVITDTVQPASSLFICRVDGAGTQTNSVGVGTRSVTSTGLFLLVVARWLHFIGYALGFGTISFSLWARAAPHDQSTWMQRIWQLVNIGIVLLLCAEPLALLAQTIGVGNTLFDIAVAGDVLASGFGLVWAQRVGVALLLWVITGVVRDGSQRALWAVPMLGLVLAIVDGTASTAGARLLGVTIAAITLHEVAMGVWLGALALLLVLWKDLERDRRNLLLMRLSRLSGAAIGVLVITGLVMATLRLTQPADLVTTLYGALLIIKLLVALLAIGLAVFAQRTQGVVWLWRAGLTTLIGVLGVASLLISVPSP